MLHTSGLLAAEGKVADGARVTHISIDIYSSRLIDGRVYLGLADHATLSVRRRIVSH